MSASRPNKSRGCGKVHVPPIFSCERNGWYARSKEAPGLAALDPALRGLSPIKSAVSIPRLFRLRARSFLRCHPERSRQAESKDLTGSEDET